MNDFDDFIAELENEAFQQEVERMSTVHRNSFIALLTALLAVAFIKTT